MHDLALQEASQRLDTRCPDRRSVDNGAYLTASGKPRKLPHPVEHPWALLAKGCEIHPERAAAAILHFHQIEATS